MFLQEPYYIIVLMFHIISSMIAVGAVTITDYFHLSGLKNRKLERKLFSVYPLLTKIIIYTIIIFTLSGILLVINNPQIIERGLFKLKMVLVVIVIINGIFLNKKVSPDFEKCALDGKKYCKKETLLYSSIAGAISIVTWYSILIIAFTKKYGYSVPQFLKYYALALIIVFFIALYIQNKSKPWKK